MSNIISTQVQVHVAYIYIYNIQCKYYVYMYFSNLGNHNHYYTLIIIIETQWHRLFLNNYIQCTGTTNLDENTEDSVNVPSLTGSIST